MCKGRVQAGRGGGEILSRTVNVCDKSTVWVSAMSQGQDYCVIIFR